MESTKKIYTINVKQDSESRFSILHRDGDDEKMFGGFYNEVQCPGSEDESFSYGLVKWVDRVEDGAVMFKTYQEAKDFLAMIDEPEDECAIVLYGKGIMVNNMLGSYWYPLQIFKPFPEE